MSTHTLLLQRITKVIPSASLSFTRNLSNKTCTFTKPRRKYYLRQYPVLIVLPNGATYTTRYDEPRAIIKLPVDMSKLSEAEKLEFLESRRPKKKIQYKTEDMVDFNPDKYLKYIRKK